MFKKFKDSAYFKAAMTMLICGIVLIMFNNWTRNSRIALGFAAVNEVLFPFYIGIALSFLLCPLYNRIVSRCYANMTRNESHKSERQGLFVPRERGVARELSTEERRSCLNSARAVASVVCLLLVMGLSALFIYAIVPQIFNSSVALVTDMPAKLAALSDWLAVNFSRFPMLSKWVDNLADSGTMAIIDWVNRNVINSSSKELINAVSSGVINAISYAVNIFIGMLIMVYLLNYKEKIFAIARKLMAACCKPRTQDGLLEFGGIINETFVGFIVGRVIDSMIIGVLTYIVLLVVGISYAPMISVIVGVTNVIPFFGPFIGAIPSFLILMLESPREAFLFLIIILIIQQLDGNVIGPKCVGNAIGIDSFWVLVSVLVGGGLFGFAGMFLGVPVFAVIYRYIDKMTIKRLRAKGKATHTSDYFTLDSFGIDKNEVNLEAIDANDKAFHKKFVRRRAVELEMVAEAYHDELKDEIEDSILQTINENINRTVSESAEFDGDIEALKNEIARELLMKYSTESAKESEAEPKEKTDGAGEEGDVESAKREKEEN